MMVDLPQQMREGVEKKYSRESLETMLLWGADEIDRQRKADAVWRQKYSLLESQFANCHKEIKRLREALLTGGDTSDRVS
jgi:hypothetical protein